MDTFDLIAKILGIVSPILSIAGVIATRKKESDKSSININQRENNIVFRPTLTINKNYENNPQNAVNNSVKTKTENHSQRTSNSDAFEGFFLIAIIFMLASFVALRRFKQLIIMSFLLLSVFSMVVSLVNIRKNSELLREKSVAHHLILCVLGTLLPMLSNLQLFQPMPFELLYAKLFPENVGGLANIISTMFLESTKLRKPTDYYLFVFAGLILIALYEVSILLSSIKFCRTKKTVPHKFTFEAAFFTICALTVTGITYQIIYSIGVQIESFMSWVSSPSFHLS